MSTERRWWIALGAYAVVIYASLPIAPTFGVRLLRTSVGAWLFGSGTVLFTTGAAVCLAMALRRRSMSWGWFLQLALVAAAYLAALGWLQTYRLERAHLPEYGVAAWLSWRAVEPLVRSSLGRYTAAAALASAIGVGDELLQALVPGRVCDPRDIATNVVAVLLALIALPVLRAAVSAGARR